MIFFKKDWVSADGHLQAYWDLNTRNKHFLRMVGVLDRLSIQNKFFHLSVYDKDLIGRDPHNLNDSSLELRARVATEASRNVWYFIRECVRVKAQGSVLPIHFELNRGNLAMIWCFLNNFNYFSVQPRQTGKTVCAITLDAYLLYSHGRNMTIAMFTKDNDLRRENVERLKSIRDGLPDYMIHRQALDTDNKEGIRYKKLGNDYLTFVAQSSDEDAGNVGRGLSFASTHIDEGAYLKKIWISYTTFMSSAREGSARAKAAGMPHGHLITTTAGRTDDPSGQFMFELMTDAWPFREKIYDCVDRDAAAAMIRAGSKNGWVNGTFSHYMLGKDDEWLREAIISTRSTDEARDRDYLNMWKAGVDDGVFGPDVMRKLNLGKRSPSYVEIVRDNFVLNWYVPEAIVNSPAFLSRPLIFGSDTSDAVGSNNDFITVVGIDPLDMRVVVTFRCNEANLTTVAALFADLLLRFNRSILIPEMKGSARGIVDSIILILQANGQNPFRRVFSRLVQERETDQYRDIDLDDRNLINDRNKVKLMGFNTDAVTRDILYRTTLKRAIGQNISIIYDEVLISEISGLKVKNGRVDHKSGKHDDMVIAYLLACWFIYYGKNHREYGLLPEMMIDPVQVANPDTNPAYVRYQMRLRNEYATMATRAQTEYDPVLKRYLEMKLKLLERDLDPNIQVNPITVEGMRNDSSLMAANRTATNNLNNYSLNSMLSLFGGVT